MINRRQFHIGELRNHFNKGILAAKWWVLHLKKPWLCECVRATYQQMKSSQPELTDDTHLEKLKAGLVTMEWVLGTDLTTELLTIGQVPILQTLMRAEKSVLCGRWGKPYLDLQVVMALTAIKAISYHQTMERPSDFTRRLIDEFCFSEEMRQAMINTAANAGLGVALTRNEFSHRTSAKH